MEFEPKCWVLTVVLELDHKFVDDLNPAGTFRKADAIASRREPLPDCLQSAVVVVTCHVVEHRSVVYERIQFSAHKQQTLAARCTSPDLQCMWGFVQIRWVLCAVVYTVSNVRLPPIDASSWRCFFLLPGHHYRYNNITNMHGLNIVRPPCGSGSVE